MRITKRVEAYVKEQVEAGMPFGAPTTEYRAARKKMEEAASEIKPKIDSYIAQLCAEASAKLPEGFKITPSDWRHVNTSAYGSPLAKAASAHEQEVRQKRKKAVDGILLSLELGATKADLERLISEAIS